MVRGASSVLPFFLALAAILPQPSRAAATRSQNPELHLRVDASLVQKLLNQALSTLSDGQGTLRRTLPDFNRDIPFSIPELGLEPVVAEALRDLAKIDLKGQGSVHVLLEQPQIEGSPFVGAPRFFRREDGTYDVQLKLEVRNFGVRFARAWFTSSGIVELDPLSPKSCHALITSQDATEGRDFLLDSNLTRAQLRERLTGFYRDLNRQKFKDHDGKLWARIDGLRIGWRSSDGYRKDRANVYVAKVQLHVDPRKGGTDVKIVRFQHNLYKKKGAWVPVRIPKAGVVLPPSFVRTQARRIEGDVLTDAELPRCTWVDASPIQKAVSGLSGEVSRQIAEQLSGENLDFLVKSANALISQVAIPELPDALVIQGEDKREVVSSARVGGQDYTVYRDFDFDFDKDLRGILRDFTTYRAALGFGDILASEGGEYLEMPMDSDLWLDGTRLHYRERRTNKSQAPSARFKWSNTHVGDASVAVHGSLLNKLLKPIKDHLLKTKVPYGFQVHVQDDLFKVDSSGRIDVSPRILIDWKGIDLLRVTFSVKARPEIVHGHDGRSSLKLKLEVPDAATILSNIRPSQTVSSVEFFVDLLSYGLYSSAIKPEIVSALRREMQAYINALTSNVKDVDLTPFIKSTGVLPYALNFNKHSYSDGAMDLRISLRRLPVLDEMVRGLE